MISELIDKQDSFEIVRDQIAAILTLEIANQMQLATDAAKDPDDWKLRIFIERSNPWEQWLNNQDDESPIVNVWYDNSNFNQSASNVVEQQNAVAVYNIDCFAIGISEDDGSGHKPGDLQAALNVQKAIRLVRNILMAGEYTYLGLRGLVWGRWMRNISLFQPQQESNAAQKILGARLSFEVSFNEFSPQVPAVTLELLSVNVKRIEDGQIVVEADYTYPL